MFGNKCAADAGFNEIPLCVNSVHGPNILVAYVTNISSYSKHYRKHAVIRVYSEVSGCVLTPTYIYSVQF